jgi:hypothetical protein
VHAADEGRDEVNTEAQAKVFESGVPSARLVQLPHANHYVFLSNEPDVLREMNAFLAQPAEVAREQAGDLLYPGLVPTTKGHLTAQTSAAG